MTGIKVETTILSTPAALLESGGWASARKAATAALRLAGLKYSKALDADSVVLESEPALSAPLDEPIALHYTGYAYSHEAFASHA